MMFDSQRMHGAQGKQELSHPWGQLFLFGVLRPVDATWAAPVGLMSNSGFFFYWNEMNVRSNQVIIKNNDPNYTHKFDQVCKFILNSVLGVSSRSTKINRNLRLWWKTIVWWKKWSLGASEMCSHGFILLMAEILHHLLGSFSHLYTRFYTSQVVQDFFHQQ